MKRLRKKLSRSASRPRIRNERPLRLEQLETRSLLTAVPVPANLVSWWTGNNTADDVMGVHHGTLVGGASYAPGKVGQGFSLDGINDTVTLAGTFGGGPEATLEAWVKTTGTNSDLQAIISATESQFVHLQLASFGNNVAYADSGAVVSMPNILQTPTDTWRHIAFTIKSGDSRLYVDGGLVGTSTATFTSLLTTTTFRIGSGYTGARFFQGGIDEVSYYSRALNAGEVQGIYKAGSDGKVFSPIAVDAPSVIEGMTGTTTPVTFTIQRTGSLSGPLTVNWSTADDTATAGSDYVSAAGQVTFLDGDATKTIQVLINGDNSPEANETFKLILTPVGQSPVMGLATILEDDVGVSVDDATATEGDVRIGQSMGAFVSQGDNGGLDRSSGMAWGPDGNLYVGSLNNNKILRFNGTTGTFLGTFISGVASPAPQGLSFRPDGKVYVLSRDANQVQRYDSTTGAFVDVFIQPGSGGLSLARGMTIGPDGNWYICSTNTNQVLRFSGATGDFLGAFVSAGSGGLSSPRGLSFGPDGNLYVGSPGSNAVLQYNGQTGVFISAFVPTGSGGLRGVAELQFSAGSLYVVSQNTQEVLRYDAQTGTFLDKPVTTGLGGNGPLGLLFDSNHNLLVGGEYEILHYGPRSLSLFTVRLSIPSATPVTVNYNTASGSATAGSDFTPMSGTLTFAPGETSKSVPVQTVDDTISELAETFTVNLSNQVGGVITTGTGTSTILDNDPIVLTRSLANVTGNVLSALTNTGTWSFPQSQNELVTLTASLGDVVKNANGTWSWSLVPSTKLVRQQVTITANYGTNSSTVTFAVDALVAVTNRQVYYKGSSFASGGADNALDPNKVLAQSGAAPQTLSYSNLINTTRGINGIVLDVAGLASASLTASDFAMRVSPTGFFDEVTNPPSSWAAAPAPTGIFVTPGTGTTPARVRLEWADNAIENRWLQIRILANANTGLLSSQIYYLGHLRGEINGQTIGGAYFVNNADLTAALPVGQVALVGNTRDVDKNGFVLNADFIIIRLGIINGLVLQNITIPAAGSANEGGFGMRPSAGMSPLPPITPIVVATPIVIEQPLAIATLDPAPRRLDQSIAQTGVKARRGASADEDPFLQHPTQEIAKRGQDSKKGSGLFSVHGLHHEDSKKGSGLFSVHGLHHELRFWSPSRSHRRF